jgi:hypothetical protein
MQLYGIVKLVDQIINRFRSYRGRKFGVSVYFAVVLLLQFLNHNKNGDRDREQCRVAWHSLLLATSLALAACMTASSPPCRALEKGKKTGALCSPSCFF